MGLRDEQILSYNSRTDIVHARTLIRPTSMHDWRIFSPCFVDAVHWFREKIEREQGPLRRADKAKRLFVRRSGGSIRQLVNRDELIEIARAFGFEIIHPETLPLIDQWRHFASADVVVGEYGSALHSSVFSAPGTTICCLRGPIASAGYMQSAIGEAFSQPTGYVFGEAAPGIDDGSYAIDGKLFADCLDRITRP
jgi:capsular polysaccharide biosynthesis protein